MKGKTLPDFQKLIDGDAKIEGMAVAAAHGISPTDMIVLCEGLARGRPGRNDVSAYGDIAIGMIAGFVIADAEKEEP